MIKFLRNSLAMLFLLAMPLWSVSARSAGPVISDHAVQEQAADADLLCGALAEAPGLAERVDAIAAFLLSMDQVQEDGFSAMDREFIRQGIAGNTLEIMSLEYALKVVDDDEFVCTIQMMLAMHKMDLGMFMAVAEKLDINTEVDLNMVPVYPHTVLYDLGVRTIDVEALFLEPITYHQDIPEDEVVHHILVQEHELLLDTARAAELLVRNHESKALARHSADVAGLHLMLLHDLANRLFFGYSVPLNFEAPYVDPHDAVRAVDDNEGS